jgi:hypothetical protein
MSNPKDSGTGKRGLDDLRGRLLNFRLDIIKTVSVVAGVAVAAGTFAYQQFAADGATTRELQRPYDEKKLNLYLEATRIVAILAANPSDPNFTAKEARFWELYWGELAFVESKAIEEGMVKFCEMHFGPERCHAGRNPKLSHALDFSRLASKEIQQRWLGRSLQAPQSQKSGLPPTQSGGANPADGQAPAAEAPVKK